MELGHFFLKCLPDQPAGFLINELGGDVGHHRQVCRFSLRYQLLLLDQFILLTALRVVLLYLVEVAESLGGRIVAIGR